MRFAGLLRLDDVDDSRGVDGSGDPSRVVAFFRKAKTMSERIKRREDVNPERGEHEYGDVTFADPVNNKYPIDTAEHVRAAWSYINHADNAAKYRADEVKTIKARIKKAAKRHGVEISDD
jgi:hypothetical protein